MSFQSSAIRSQRRKICDIHALFLILTILVIWQRSTAFYDLSVSRDLFSEVEMGQFGAPETEGFNYRDNTAYRIILTYQNDFCIGTGSKKFMRQKVARQILIRIVSVVFIGFGEGLEWAVFRLLKNPHYWQ